MPQISNHNTSWIICPEDDVARHACVAVQVEHVSNTCSMPSTGAARGLEEAGKIRMEFAVHIKEKIPQMCIPRKVFVCCQETAICVDEVLLPQVEGSHGGPCKRRTQQTRASRADATVI